jgi:hypothetical protein
MANFFGALLLVVVVVLLSPLVIVYVFWRLLTSLWLCLLVRVRWYPKRKVAVFVYSNSPHWKEYIETNLLPKLSPYAAVLNWSEKSRWPQKWYALSRQIFEHWAGVSLERWKGKLRWGPKRELGVIYWGGEEFNPIAIVFVPWWKPKVFRFWKAFKDFKHGRDKALRDLEADLAVTLDRARVILSK